MTHEEAFDKARAAYGTGAYDDATLEFLFPELKESEDEKIRKGLISHLKELRDWKIGTMSPIRVPITYDVWIDYLEKQKEQKPAEKQDYSGLDDFERAIHRGFICAGVENVPVTIIKETAQDCLVQMKPAEWSEEYREEDIQTRFAFYTYKDDSSVLYLSNVFVEESSRNHGFGTRILRAAEKAAEAIGATTISLRVKQDSPANEWYRKHGYGYVAFEDGYDWLEKNLEYMKSKPKQEWSEEDKEMLDTILQDLANIQTAFPRVNILPEFDWLKSLRNRFVWKPSKEQMEALEETLEFMPDDSKIRYMLVTLYNDLNKSLM